MGNWFFLSLTLDHLLRGFGLTVFAAFLNDFALGAPVDPALRICSPEPAAIRLRFACMLE
tara:strand:- start:2307 stop:2486 length:180 start_codon:yes stop_codon:yes gene_type:complete